MLTGIERNMCKSIANFELRITNSKDSKDKRFVLTVNH